MDKMGLCLVGQPKLYRFNLMTRYQPVRPPILPLLVSVNKTNILHIYLFRRPMDATSAT